jgi:hypothetical protein
MLTYRRTQRNSRLELGVRRGLTAASAAFGASIASLPVVDAELSNCRRQNCFGASRVVLPAIEERKIAMIRKLSSGKYRLYSRKADPSTGKRRNLGTFGSRAAAEKHERAVQYFKHH